MLYTPECTDMPCVNKQVVNRAGWRWVLYYIVHRIWGYKTTAYDNSWEIGSLAKSQGWYVAWRVWWTYTYKISLGVEKGGLIWNSDHWRCTCVEECEGHKEVHTVYMYKCVYTHVYMTLIRVHELQNLALIGSLAKSQGWWVAWRVWRTYTCMY